MRFKAKHLKTVGAGAIALALTVTIGADYMSRRHTFNREPQAITVETSSPKFQLDGVNK